MPAPCHVLTIASEQLWPQLLGLNYLRERDGAIRSLHILHSADSSRSLEPAKRLKRLAAAMLPGIRVELHSTGTTADDVSRVSGSLLQLRTDAPWAINCSGGTKLMFAGLMAHLAHDRVQAFYREVTGEWFLLRAAHNDGVRSITCSPLAEAANSKLRLSVHQLVEAQSEIPDNAAWVQSPAPDVDVLGIVHEGIRTGWNWSRLAALHPELTQMAGPFFEIFVASLVKILGVQDIALSLKLRTPRHAEIQEFDIVASTGRNLVLLDLKLTGPEEDQAPSTQIMRIASNRTALGGLGGTAIAVRPSWTPVPDHKELARGLSVQLWTAEDMGDFVQRLASALDARLPDVGGIAVEIDSLLRAERDRGQRILTYERAPRPRPHAPHVERAIGVLDIAHYLANELRPREQPVVLVDSAPWLIVYGKAVYCGWGDRKVFEKDLAEMCTVVLHETTDGGAIFLAICKAVSSAANALLKHRIMTGRLDDEHMKKWEKIQKELKAAAEARNSTSATKAKHHAGQQRHGKKHRRKKKGPQWPRTRW